MISGELVLTLWASLLSIKQENQLSDSKTSFKNYLTVFEEGRSRGKQNSRFYPLFWIGTKKEGQQ